MSTNFPVSKDNFASIPPSQIRNDLALQVTNRGDAIDALQDKVGIDGSADTNSLDYKINNIIVSPSQITGLTASIAELNVLDGITSTTAELNKLDGFTGTAADLNTVSGRAGDDYATTADVTASQAVVQGQINSGWTESTVTATYVSATTFTVSGDLTARYVKGSKIRLKQAGAYKYWFVASSVYSAPNTTVTVYSNNDYTLANAAITDLALTKDAVAEGFPEYFSYTPTFNGTLGNGTLSGYYTLMGRTCHLYMKFIFGSTSAMNATDFRFNLPTNANATSASRFNLSDPTLYAGNAVMTDVGNSVNFGLTRVFSSTVAKVEAMNAGGTYLTVANITTTIPFTWGTADYVVASLTYEIA